MSIQTTLRFDPEFHKKIRITIAERGIRSIQVAVEMALNTWLATDSGKLTVIEKTQPPVSGYAKENKEAHNLLEEILSSGTPEQANLISGNLQIFVEATRASADKQQRKRKTG